MNPNSQPNPNAPGVNLPGVVPSAEMSQQPLAAPQGAGMVPSQPMAGNFEVSPSLIPQIDRIVAEAEHVMNQPHLGPYEQNQALQRLKAQYIKALYNINLTVT